MRIVLDSGTSVYLGTTETSPTIGIIDYSRRVTDDFGVTTVVERGFARRMSVRLGVPFESVDVLQAGLADLRATPAMWVADDRFASLAFRGFYKDFAIDLAVPPLAYCTLTVEGLADGEAFVDPGLDPAPEGLPSTLQLLQPIDVSDAVLAASNVDEVDHPGWASGISYPAGARVILATTHRVYESMVAGNLGNDPAAASGKWLDVGPTNRWAMFDQALGSVTRSAGSIDVTLNAGASTGLALLDVVGAAVRVRCGSYDRTMAIAGGALTFLDLPGSGAAIRVTITGAGGVSVGTLLAGRLVSLGITEASPTAGITDYSRKEVDDFGEVTIVQRAFAKRMSAKALIATSSLDVVANRIAAVRARPSLWIGQTGLDCLTIYGFFKDFSIEVGETVSKLALSIEGLSVAAKVAPLGAGVNWGDIADPDGTKPANNADVTGDNIAKDTNAVGGRPAQQIVAATDKIVSIEARLDPITTDISALKDARVEADVAIGALVDRVAPAEAEISALKLAEQRLTPALDALDGVVADQAAAQRGADEAVGRIEEALLRTLLESARTRDVLRDAGIVVDPATGVVRIFAVDQLKDRTSTAEIAIDAVKSVVSTKASVNQVNELIALAVLDPSQVAELEPIIARLTQAESRIDGLNAAVTLKASVAELTALTTRTRATEIDVDAMKGQIALKANADVVDQIGLRTSEIEQTLTSLPDTAGFVVSVQQARAVAEDTADALLRTLAAGEDAARYQVTQIAQARQELSTRMVDGFTTEALARTALSVRIDQTTATMLAESQASITRDNAMTRRIDAQGVTLGDQSAAIGDLRTASIDAAGGIASTQMTIRQVIGAADDSDEAMLRALANGEQAAQARAMQLVQIQTEFTTTLVADRAASAAASQAILARMGAAEAAIVTTSKVLADTTGAYGDRLNALEVGFANPITGLAATRVRINAVERASADADEALGERIDTIDAVVNDAVTGLPATQAALVAGLKAAADRDAAFVDQFEQITAELYDPNTGLAATLATVVSNRRAMVEADAALTERIDAQGVALDDQAASIGRLDIASIAAGRGIAATQMTIRQVVSADEDDAEALLRTLAAGEVSNQTRAMQLVQIQTDFTTTLVAGQLSQAVMQQVLLARIGSAEAAIVTTSKVVADAQRAFTSRQDALEAAFNDAATGLRATSARIVALAELTAEQNRVVVQRLDLMDARLLDPVTGEQVTGATIARDRKTAADANGGTARDLGQLTAKVNDPATGLAKTRAELTSLGEAVASDREASAQSLTEVRATITTKAVEVAAAAEQSRAAGEERLQAGLDSNGRAIVAGDSLNAQGIADANAAREAGDSANNQRIFNVDARVTDLVRVQANDNEARAEAIRQVTARLNGNGVTIEEKIEAIVEATGKITGTRTMAIDINGNLVGYKLIGSQDGPGSLNLINTDLKMGTGRIIFRAGAYEKRGGAIFGANSDLAEWFGLATIPLGQETIANSRWAQAADGQSYIGGANIEASVSGPNRIKQVGLNGSTSSSGNATTTIATVSAGFPPNGRFRITGRITSASATNGGGGVAGTWRLAFFVNYGSGPQLIAEAPCSIDPATGAIEDGVLALSGQLFPNPGTGLGNIIVTSTRTGPPSSGISSDWTGSAIFEWVNA
ncbi:hypothetical protein NF699_06390 [Sphingomonadaceae bacterium OTU29LAMAA1]|nr:hypothetical protein NF699_06390 [Sphingomonadaceae bacterium OTU29LAMAA1]